MLGYAGNHEVINHLKITYQLCNHVCAALQSVSFALVPGVGSYQAENEWICSSFCIVPNNLETIFACAAGSCARCVKVDIFVEALVDVERIYCAV
jgi:hypothetical protein